MRKMVASLGSAVFAACLFMGVSHASGAVPIGDPGLKSVCARAWNNFADLRDGNGDVCASVQIKLGKKNRQDKIKVSATGTRINGKKISARATTVQLEADGEGIATAWFVLNFQGDIGPVYCEMIVDSDGCFDLDGWSYSGYSISASYSQGMYPEGLWEENPVFTAELDHEHETLWPYDTLCESVPDYVPFVNLGTKWVFPRADTVKIATFKDCDYIDGRRQCSIEYYLDIKGEGENMSGLKLTYNRKTRAFKGSCKILLSNAEAVYPRKPTLKKIPVTVTGVVTLGGVGVGMTSTRQGIFSAPVRIE